MATEAPTTRRHLLDDSPRMEGEICELAHAADIAALLAEDFRYEENEKRGLGLWITAAEAERLTFAIYEVDKRARELKALYYGEDAAKEARA